jgi:hypothetical protein
MTKVRAIANTTQASSKSLLLIGSSHRCIFILPSHDAHLPPGFKPSSVKIPLLGVF